MILSLQQLAFVIHRQIYQLFFFGFSTLFHIWFREGEDSCRISIIFWRKKKIGVSVSPAFKKPETFLPRDVPFYRLFSGEICRIIPVVIVRCEWRCSDTVLPIPAAVFLLFKSLNWKFTRPSPSNRVKEKFICSPLERDIFLFPSRPRWRSMAVPWPVEMKPNRLLLLLLLSRSCSTTVQHWIFNLENDRFRFIDAAPLWDPLFCWHTNNAPWPIYEKLTDFISIFLFVSSLLLSFFCFCFKLPTGKVLFNHLLTGSGNMLTRFLKFPVFEAVAVRDRSRIIALYRWSVESGPILIVWF